MLFSQNTVELTTSKLPIIVINTNGQEIPDEPKIVASMGIINNGYNVTNNITDAYTDYNGKISIEIRGQSSQDFPKKSYGFETQDALGENNNVSLLGMPEENDWILYAPYSDKSMLRNVMSFEMGKILDPYCSRTAYCELIVNNVYQGIYVLMEKIKKDEERVNIASLNEDEISGDDLTGGYIFKVDKTDDYEYGDGWESNASLLYFDAAALTFQYFYPDADDIVDAQRTYIEDYVTETENVLASNNFDNPDYGYNKYLNTGSFVDYLIINEIAKEVDSYRFSTYFNKKKESKGNEIYAGPIWDFNLGYGNVDYWPIYEHDYEKWAYEVMETPFMRIHWWKRLMEDTHFKNLLKTRWEFLRANEFSNESIIAKIDSITEYIDEAQQRNYTAWPILGEYVWPNYDWEANTYADEVSYYEEWLLNRMEWMDDNIGGSELYPSATIEPDPDNSNSLLLTLSDEYFNNRKLRSKYFELKFGPEALYIDSVYWINSSEARIAIGSSDPSYSASSVAIVTIDDNIVNGFNDIETNSLSSTEDVPFAQFQLKVYSSAGTINIESESPEDLPQYIEVFNALGQHVNTYSIEQQHKNIVPVELRSGVYLVRLLVDREVHTRRVVIK